MKLTLFCIAASFLLSSCLSSGGSGGTPVDIPEADITCTSSKCTSANGSFDAVVTLSLSGCAPDQIDLNTVATGFASAICGVSGCTATVSSWTAAGGGSITQVPSGGYDVCGWIDLDSNASKDSAHDAFSEDSTSLSADASPFNITNWSVTYSSRSLRPHR